MDDCVRGVDGSIVNDLFAVSVRLYDDIRGMPLLGFVVGGVQENTTYVFLSWILAFIIVGAAGAIFGRRADVWLMEEYFLGPRALVEYVRIVK